MKHVFSAVVVACIATQILYAQTMNRSMDTNDPNRDPNWVWYEANQRFVTLYPAGLPPQGVTLPFFDNTGPATAFITDLTDGPMDIYPNQGWELVLRDFGTPQTQQDIPFFILYNKYRGILRLYYWDPDNSQQTRVVGVLRFQGSNRTGNMTLGFDNVTLDNYQDIESYQQIAVGDYQNRSWCFMDFDLSGYDPDVVNQTDPTFIIELHGRTTSDLILSGTLDFEHEKGSVTAVQDAADKYTKAAKRYKGVTAAKKVYKEWGEAEPNKWYANILKNASNVATNSFIPFLGAAAGILDFAIGNGGKGPLLKKAYLELSGQLTTQTLLSTLTFRVPGSTRSNPTIDALSNRLPLYDVPLGVFNLVSKPVVRILVTEREEHDYDGPLYYPTYHHYLRSFQPVFNPHVFSDMDIELSYQWTGLDNVDRSFISRDLDDFLRIRGTSGLHSQRYSSRGGKPWINAFEKNGIRHVLGMTASLTPINSGVEKTQIVKAYHPEHIGFESLYPHNVLPEHISHAPIPFYEDFQSTNNHWSFASQTGNRPRITAESAPFQGYYLAIDNSKSGGDHLLKRSEANLYVNIPPTTKDVWLDFRLRRTGPPVQNIDDGIHLSVDGGISFFPIFPMHNIYWNYNEEGPWYSYSVDLTWRAKQLGLTLSPTSIIRFAQFINSSTPNKAMHFDQVRVYEEGNKGQVSDYPMVSENLHNVSAKIFFPPGHAVGNYTGKIWKTSRCVCWNGGASSKNTIPSFANGSVKTYVTEDNIHSNFMFGLSHEDIDFEWYTIDYNMYVSKHNGYKISIYERGNHRYSYPGDYQVGDELKVERLGSRIHFKINGQSIYSLPVDRNKPMVTDVSLYNEGAEIDLFCTAFHRTFWSPGVPIVDPGPIPNPWPTPPGLPSPIIVPLANSHSNLNTIPNLNTMPGYELPAYGYDVSVDTAMFSKEPFELEKTRVFPNPIENIFTLEYDSDHKRTVGISYWSSIDPSIRQSFSWDVEEGLNRRRIDFSSVPAGFYILQLNDGDELSSIHIIKE